MRVLVPLAVLLHLVAAGNYVSYPAGVTYVSQPTSGHLITAAPISYAAPIPVSQPNYVYAVPAVRQSPAPYHGTHQRLMNPQQQDIVYADSKGNNGVQHPRQGMHTSNSQSTAEPRQTSQSGHYVQQYSSQKSVNGQERQTARFTNNVSPYQYSTTVEHGPESYHHIVVSHSKSANYVQVNQTNDDNDASQEQADNPATKYQGSQKYQGTMAAQKLQRVVQVTESSPEQHSVHVVQTPSKTSVHVTPAPEAAQNAAQYSRTSNQRGNYERQGHYEVMPLRDPPSQHRQATMQRYRSEEQSGRRSHYSAQHNVNVQRVPQRYQNAAPAQQKSQKYQVRTPAIHNQFYDIEERVIVRPVGSALVEFPSQQLNAADCSTSGESQYGNDGHTPQPSLQGFDDIDRQPQPNYGPQYVPQQQPQYFGGSQYYPAQPPQFIFAHPSPGHPVFITTSPQYPSTPASPFVPSHPTASPPVFITTPSPVPSTPAPGSFGGASSGEDEDTVVIDAKRRYGNRVYPKRKNCDEETESKKDGGDSQYDGKQDHEVSTTYRPTYMPVKPLAPKDQTYESGKTEHSASGKADDDSHVVISITRKKVDEEVKVEEKPIYEKSGEGGKTGKDHGYKQNEEDNGYVYESKQDGIDYNRKNKEHGYGNFDSKSAAGESGYEGNSEKGGQDEVYEYNKNGLNTNNGYENKGQEGGYQGENGGYDQEQGKSYGDDEERHDEPNSKANNDGSNISRDYLPAPPSDGETGRDEFLHEPLQTESPHQPQVGEYRNQYARYNTQPQRPQSAQYKSTSRKTYSNPQYEEHREVAYRTSPQQEFAEEYAEMEKKMQRFRQEPIYQRQRQQTPKEEQLPLVITRGSQSEQENAENQKNLFKLLTERENVAQVGYARPGQQKAALMDAGVLRGRVISVTPAPANAQPTEERVNTRRIVISRPIETIHEDEAPENGDLRSYQNQKSAQNYVAQRPQRS